MAFELLLVALPPETRDFDGELGRRVAASLGAKRFCFWDPGTKRIGSQAVDDELGLSGSRRAGDVCRAGRFPRGYIVHHLIRPAGDYLGVDHMSCFIGQPPDLRLDAERLDRLQVEWPAAIEREVSGWPPDWWAVEVYANV